MSAGITLEPVTIEQKGMYMGRAGRIYCVDCVAADRVEHAPCKIF